MLKFPICRKNNKCKASVAGILAARRRAILTKKYPEIVTYLTKIINERRLTKKVLQNLPIKKVHIPSTIVKEPLAPHYDVVVTYSNDQTHTFPQLSRHTILRKYSTFLKPCVS